MQDVEWNKRLIHAFAEAINGRDWHSLDELVAVDFIRHSYAAPGVRSRQELKRYLREEFVTFPDAFESIEDMVAEGDSGGGPTPLLRDAGRADGAVSRVGQGGVWQQAQQLLASPQLVRFFDAAQYRAAYNEMPYVNAKGELKRIDRLVEFDDEEWVLDYKLGDAEEAARHRAQMEEYRAAMRAVYPGKTVRCLLVFADTNVSEV